MSSRIFSGTPVNSLQLIMPCVYWQVGTATLPHSMPVLAPHSMKWKRLTDGRRMISSTVKTSGFFSILVVRAVDHQAVPGGVDVPPALMVALEVQAAGGDDAEQALKRREGHRRLGGLRQARARPALHVGLVLRRLAVAVGGHGLPQALAVGGQVQDVGVTAFGRHRVGLSQHGRGRGARQSQRRRHGARSRGGPPWLRRRPGAPHRHR